ncbi:MAG: hypothetical protein Ct9H300mP14_12870 [Gammaproteobacteria bacterium]|nr:MAG: hypothetical protein Ct9H300mP14_12870 [Gammaproteobacteria bacterium]
MDAASGIMFIGFPGRAIPWGEMHPIQAAFIRTLWIVLVVPVILRWGCMGCVSRIRLHASRGWCMVSV